VYVKLYNQILDSSLAEDRRLRHFFTDLLLCADQDGNVTMTLDAISRKTRAAIEEVEWGLAELQKPDAMSFHQECEGRRVIPLEGCGYGWKIVNYELYRDFKTAKELRKATAERVKRYRENRKVVKPSGNGLYKEAEVIRREKEGDVDGSGTSVI